MSSSRPSIRFLTAMAAGRLLDSGTSVEACANQSLPMTVISRRIARYTRSCQRGAPAQCWERWLDFFAEGIEVSATQAVATANALLALVNADRYHRAGPADDSALTQAFNNLRAGNSTFLEPICSVWRDVYPARLGSKFMVTIRTEPRRQTIASTSGNLTAELGRPMTVRTIVAYIYYRAALSTEKASAISQCRSWKRSARAGRRSTPHR